MFNTNLLRITDWNGEATAFAEKLIKASKV